MFLPQAGKQGRYRTGLAQKGGWVGDGTCLRALHNGRVCVVEPLLLLLVVRPLTAALPLSPTVAGMAVFLNSLGELTAYDYDGQMLWQASDCLQTAVCSATAS